MENQQVNRSIIKVLVRHMVRSKPENLRRNLNYLVDLGATVLRGEKQAAFIAGLKTSLEKKDSVIYRLARDKLAAVDPDQLAALSFNFGYMSLVAGNRRLKRVQQLCGHRVPFMAQAMAESLEETVEGMKALGIYLYCLDLTGAPGEPEALRQTILRHQDCIFLCFVPGDRPVDETVMALLGLDHVLMHLDYQDSRLEQRAEEMRDKKRGFNIFLRYGQEDLPGILDGSALKGMMDAGCFIPIFLAREDCPVETRRQVYQYVLRVRLEEKLPAFPLEWDSDVAALDRLLEKGPGQADVPVALKGGL